MATVRIYRGEADGALLPHRCVKCGEETDGTRAQRFAWMPPWVHVFLFLGLLPWLIAAAVTRKAMTVTVPVCDRHRNHWLVRKLYVGIGLLALVGLAVGLGVLHKELDRDATTAGFGVLVFGGLGWLIGGMILVSRSVRAGEITDRWIELVHVHRDFAHEWKAVAPPEATPVRRRRRPPRDWQGEE